NGLRIGGNTLGAVACRAGLRLGLDLIRRKRRRDANNDSQNHPNKACGHERSLPPHIVAGCRGFHQESLMRARLMLTLAATAAAMVFPPVVQIARAESPTVLTGTVSSEAEGKMEGVVVTAQAQKSIVRVSVTTDAQGRYSFPQSHLKPGRYALSTRAVGYDIESPVTATVGD